MIKEITLWRFLKNTASVQGKQLWHPCTSLWNYFAKSFLILNHAFISVTSFETVAVVDFIHGWAHELFWLKVTSFRVSADDSKLCKFVTNFLLPSTNATPASWLYRNLSVMKTVGVGAGNFWWLRRMFCPQNWVEGRWMKHLPRGRLVHKFSQFLMKNVLSKVLYSCFQRGFTEMLGTPLSKAPLQCVGRLRSFRRATSGNCTMQVNNRHERFGTALGEEPQGYWQFFANS